MVLATLLLLCAAPQGDEAKVTAASNPNADRQVLSASVSDSATPGSTTKDSTPAAAVLPSTPEPKVKPEVEPVPLRSAAQPFLAVRRRPVETPRQRKMWFGLMAVSHAGAAFDAWSTRRAISSGYGQEANPFLKPFANSNAIYAATQVSPAVMDYLGKRMMTSQNPGIRRLWWIPQLMGTSMSFAAGAHNLGVVR